MSEEDVTSPSMPEHKGNVLAENAQAPVINIIDGIEKPIGMVLHENAKCGFEDPFVQENLEENRTPHGITESGHSIQLRDKDRKTEGVSDTKTSEDNSENQITGKDQMATEKSVEETVDSLRKINKVKELVESRQKTRDELQPVEILEELEIETVDQSMQLIKSGEELCSSMQENSPECSPPGSSSMKVLPGSGNNPDISRHSYSRYNTVSYRKIRKGNTKQRVDEFESMNL